MEEVLFRRHLAALGWVYLHSVLGLEAAAGPAPSRKPRGAGTQECSALSDFAGGEAEEAAAGQVGAGQVSSGHHRGDGLEEQGSQGECHQRLLRVFPEGAVMHRPLRPCPVGPRCWLAPRGCPPYLGSVPCLLSSLLFTVHDGGGAPGGQACCPKNVN